MVPVAQPGGGCALCDVRLSGVSPNRSFFMRPIPPALHIQEDEDSAGNEGRDTVSEDGKDNPCNIGYDPQGKPSLPLLPE
jgi:hypothetical protein